MPTIIHGVNIDAVLNQPPAQRYSGPEAIARRDELLLKRALASPLREHKREHSRVKVRDVELTNKDLGT